jgi:hypothetical protein
VVVAGIVSILGSGGSGGSGTRASAPPKIAAAITTQPTDQTVTAGQTATFSVVATGTAPLSYQWQKSGTNVAGATSSSYTTAATTSADNGAQFQVVVSNGVGSVMSNAATLTVNPMPVAPTITTQPTNQTATAGQTATFSVAANGTPAPTYQWQKNGTNIAGAASSAYTTPATTSADNGAQFQVVVSNSAGNVTSSAATLTVTSSSGGGNSTAWLPYTEAPVSGSSGGTSGLGVIPADLSSTTLQSVMPATSAAATTPIGLTPLPRIALSGSSIAAVTLAVVVFIAPGSDGNLHLYGVPLENSSAVPTPTQISSFSVPAATSLCNQYPSFHTGFSNYSDPTSAFFVITIANGASCGAGTQTVLIHYSDSAATAPTPLPVTSSSVINSMGEFYSATGTLKGIALVDATNTLNFYTAGAGGVPSFTSPVKLASAVRHESHQALTANRLGQVSDTVAFYEIQDLSSGPTGGLYAVYRIDSSANSALVYAASGFLFNQPPVWDNTNLYLSDEVKSGSTHTYAFVAAPIAGGMANQLYGTATLAMSMQYSLVDADGTTLILRLTDNTTVPGTDSLLTTGTGKLALNAPMGQSIAAFLDYSSDQLFTNFTAQALGKTSVSCAVFTPKQALAVQALQSNCEFLPGAPSLGVATGGAVFQLQNMPSDGTQGGATLYAVNPTSLAAVAITEGGSPYTVPAGNTAALFMVAPSIAIGQIIRTTASGLALDLSTKQLITVSVPNTLVTVY